MSLVVELHELVLVVDGETTCRWLEAAERAAEGARPAGSIMLSC
ncbi:hypothetical protein ACTVZO_07355 [Streptomyces sp. IBSNAI002]